MGFDCCVPDCRNSEQTDDGDIAYYPFPTDAACREKWLQFLGQRTGKYRWRSKRICSRHFRATDVVQYMGKRTLVVGALPVIYPCDLENIIVSETMDGARAEEPGSTDPLDISQSGAAPDTLIDIRTLYCRFCLLKAEKLQPIEWKPMAVKVMLVTGIDLELDELAPTYVCDDCAHKLDIAFNIRTEMLQTNQHLNDVLVQEKMTIKSSLVSDGFLSQMENTFPEALLQLELKQEIEDPTTEMRKEEHVTMKLDEEELELGGATEYVVEVKEELLDVPLFDVCILEIQTVEEHLSKRTIEKENEEGEEAVVEQSEIEQESKQIAIPSRIKHRTRKPRPTVILIPHTCYICSTSYEDKDELEEHIFSHLSLLPFTCDECHSPEFPKVFGTLPALNRHLRSHNYPYQCKECPARFKVQSSLLQHVQNLHIAEEDGYTCDICGKQFTHYGIMRNHMRVHRLRNSGRYRCKVCNIVLCSSTTLQRHARIHTGEKPFQCKLCKKRFNHEHNFALHKRLHTGEKKYSCDVCSKSFLSSTLLKYHMAEHYPDDPRYKKMSRKKADDDSKQLSFAEGEQYEKVYICPEPGCGHTSTVYAHAFYHRKKHVTPFHCPQCERKFSFASGLRRHVAIKHEGQRPPKNFPCTRCGKAFDNKQKLASHIDAHENNRKYKCRYCDKSFVQKVNCTGHERRHTGEMPYGCRSCPLRFANSAVRNRHELSVHEQQQSVAPSTTEAIKPVAKLKVVPLELSETPGRYVLEYVVTTQ